MKKNFKNCGDEIFNEEKLEAIIKLFFVSIIKFSKLQEKLNSGCKVILNGGKLPKSMLALNLRIDRLSFKIKNCLAYIMAYGDDTLFCA